MSDPTFQTPSDPPVPSTALTTTLVLRCSHCQADRIEQIPLNIPLTRFCAILDRADLCRQCGTTQGMEWLTGQARTEALARLTSPDKSLPSTP